jgi:2-polyprenyl-3-methyl-5-hydroxy-6-metoxy-1,4-benzoquinol methylase
MALDMDKLNTLVMRMLGEVGAAALGSLVLLGDRLGIYRALATGPQTAQGLATKLGMHERYIREWLHAQAAAQYIDYDAATETFSLSPEQAMVLAEPDSPASLVGGYWGVSSLYQDEPKIAEAFKTGEGVPWGAHSPCLFCGTEKFLGPAYRANLIEGWLPALDGMVAKLQRGAKVADVGCGHALSTRLMAKAFPKSHFVGIDYHQPSIDHARDVSKKEGLTNITFEQGTAQEFGGKDFDLIAFFDCLHDMGDPTGAMRNAREHLAADGTCMIVEPLAGDTLAEKMNPLGRAFLAFSTMVCVPASLSQAGRAGLGAQAGEKKLTEVIKAGGFKNVRRATQSATNMILEARG